MDQRETTWKVYSNAWHAPTAEARNEIFEASLARDCVYSDPLATTSGWDALTAYILQFQQQVPGARFAIRDFKTHNQCSVAHWDMVAEDGTVMSDGVSYGEFDADGKITKMTGFFDIPPSA